MLKPITTVTLTAALLFAHISLSANAAELIAVGGVTAKAEETPSTEVPKAPGTEDEQKRQDAQNNVKLTPILLSRHPGVKITAALTPGASIDRTMFVNLTLTLPDKSHSCLSWVGFEAISAIRRPLKKSFAGGPDIYSCVDVQNRELKARMSLQRIDLQTGWLPWMKTADVENQNIKDGFVILNLSIDGELSVYRMDSSYFKTSEITAQSK